MMATLAQEIQALLQSLPEVIPEARRLPAVAPQAVQAGNVTPQDVGQTLGPQPGERPNTSREEWLQNFGQAAGSMAASAADPLGMPSALLGTVAPGARDSWRQYQGAAGMGPQIAGSLMSGFGAANAMFRGGAALAGVPGMIAGGAATGAGPTIDYAAGAPGADGVNAITGLLAGAALPAGIAVARPVVNAVRGSPVAAAAGGATALAAGSAVAQQSQPQLDPFTQNLHSNNPALAAAYQRMLAARQAATTANQTSVSANQGRQTNSGARQAAERADTAAAEAARAYEELLARFTDEARAQNPSFREAYGPTIANRLIRSTVLPFGLGLIGGAGSASLGRIHNSMARRQVDAGNLALEKGNIPAAATASANANALASQSGGSSWVSPGMILSAGIGGEAALASRQWDQDAAPGSPAQIRADRYFDTSRPLIDFGIGALMGASAYKGGRELSGSINNLLPGRNRVPATSEAAALQRRVDAAQPPAGPVPAPPVAQPPAAANLPVDYETIARGIGARPLPPGQTPPAPPTVTNRGATLYQGDIQARIRDQLASQLVGSGSINVGALVSRMRREGIMPGVISRAQAAAQAANSMVQGGVPAAEVARRITSGEFRHLAVPAGVTAAGVAAHHSATQPRGEDGRFQSPEE